jgi:hypothetical protein
MSRRAAVGQTCPSDLESIDTAAVEGAREGDVHDQFDVTLEDGDLLGEVELTTTLIIAASESEDHLSQEEIDRLLGVTPRPRQPSED